MGADTVVNTGRGEALLSVALALGSELPIDLVGPAALDRAERCSFALSELDEGASLTRVKLLSTRAAALTTVDPEQSREHARLAERMAEGLNDELSIVYALAAGCLTRPTPEHTDERLQAAGRILDAAEEHGASELISVGYFLLLIGLLEKGEIRTLDAELVPHGRSSARFPGLHESAPARWFRCLRVILDGDIVEAERLVEHSHEHARGVEGTDSLATAIAQLGIIQWMKGAVDGAEEGFLAARRAHPEQPIWAASLAWLWAMQGRRTAAEPIFQSFADLDSLPRDRYWLPTIVVLAETSLSLGSREFAEELRMRLLPFARQLVPIGVGVAFWGTAARSLGLLEERLGLLDAAREHLEYAVEITSRIGAQAWLAEAQIDLAEFAIRHSIADIPSSQLLAEALKTSAARGFEGLGKRAMRRPRIRVMGLFEVISHDGVRATWTSRKARELLKMLVAARGKAVSREVYMDVLWPEIAPRQLANRFAVAVNTIRRALDPGRTFAMHEYVVVEGDSLRLDLDNLDIDVERFLAFATPMNMEARRSAIARYTGEVFADEPYADWAIPLRELARTALDTLRATE